MQRQPVIEILERNAKSFHSVVPFEPGKDKLLSLDFTEENIELTTVVLENTDAFSKYIENKLRDNKAIYGIGGYNEHRTIYSRSSIFNSQKPGEEPRRLHLGTDIWGAVDTPVYAFMGGRIHSFAFNNNFGDYGATLVLQHQLESVSFQTLYGHLSLKDIQHITSSQYVIRGQQIAHFGKAAENGQWPPHLHFQVVVDMGLSKGDYPGVCKYSEREKYMYNCPDPDLILQMNRFL